MRTFTGKRQQLLQGTYFENRNMYHPTLNRPSIAPRSHLSEHESVSDALTRQISREEMVHVARLAAVRAKGERVKTALPAGIRYIRYIDPSARILYLLHLSDGWIIYIVSN